MSELLRKPYKISLWEDKSLYIVENSEGRKETNELPKDDSDIIKNHVFKEVKIADIGSNTMDSPIRAFNPKFTQEINGTNTLTFDIFYRYYDEDAEEFRQNPFINLLVNERKIKLNYDGKWYHFVIKEISEDSTKQTFSYTCSDQYINELSKTGYEIELDTELENNMGTAIELGNYILEGSDWSVDEEGSNALQEYIEEPLCEYNLTKSIDAISETGEKENIPAGARILIGYASATKDEYEEVQFFYDSEGKYPVDENGFVTGVAQYSYKFNQKPKVSISNEYFGRTLVKKQVTTYCAPINMYCTKWNKVGEGEKEYYCIEDTEYASVTEVQDMLINGADFISTNGWVGEDGAVVTLIENKINIIYNGGHVVNTGFYENRALTDGFIEGEEYVFLINTATEDDAKRIDNIWLKGTNSESDSEEEILLDFKKSGTEQGFYKWVATVEKTEELKGSISYTDLLKYDLNFVIKGHDDKIDDEVFGTTITEAKLFKARKGIDENGNEILLIPDISKTDASVIKNRFRFFEPSEATKATSIDDITFTDKFYDSIDEDDYTPILSSLKVRSITGSKSNRFNLIQEICEKFECWAKFEIDADELGHIISVYKKTDDETQIPGKLYYEKVGEDITKDISFNEIIGEQDKKATGLYELRSGKRVHFLEYIEEDNPVGFRYGINLKSIQRKIDSKQIVTKTIVQPNSNEYALNGMGACTIQRASMNPSGETAIYNFNYYVQHGLLTRAELNRDLYGGKGVTGYFNALYKLNQKVLPLTDQLTELGKEKTAAEANYTILDLQYTEAEELRVECVEQLTSALNGLTEEDWDIAQDLYYEKYKKDIAIKEKTADGITIEVAKCLNDAICDLVVKRVQYETTKSQVEDKLEVWEDSVEYVTKKYNEVLNELSAIASEKAQHNRTFYQKYSRFLHEGTWISEDYVDDDLYYVDATTVARTSAYPKISYTINVVELSQVEGFEPYKFKLADRSYIEDTEFFGYDENHRPYKEEIIVSKVLYSLDDPSQNVITVQNYKTRFEDLFQRIAATTTSLQYSEGGYNRAAGAFNADGTINDEFLKNSLAKNTGLIMSAPNGELIIDQDKGTITAKSSKGNLILNSLGILIGTGNNYQTAISAEGINASVITTGRLNTGSVYIYADGQETFRWDKYGLNAYAFTEDATGKVNGVNYNQYVRFDQFGLYGNINNPDFKPKTITDVVNNATFSLTWKGLHLNIQDQIDDTIPVINVNNRFTVSGNGDVVANNLKFTGELEGKLFSKNGAIVGPELGIGFPGEINESTLASSANFYVSPEGDVTMRGSINLSEGNITWSKENSPVKVLYAATKLSIPTGNYNDYDSSSNTDWHKTLSSSNDFFASYSYSGGEAGTWTEVVKIQGTDADNIMVKYGTNKDAAPSSSDWSTTWKDSWTAANIVVYAIYSYDGGDTWTDAVRVQSTNGSNANVTYSSIRNALNAASNAAMTIISENSVETAVINAGKIYSTQIYAGQGDTSFASMTQYGFDVTDALNNHKIGLGLEYHPNASGGSKDVYIPYLSLGCGAGNITTDSGLIKKFPTGLWIGDSSRAELYDPTTKKGSGDGIYISFESHVVYKVIKGEFTEIGEGGGGTAIAVFG